MIQTTCRRWCCYSYVSGKCRKDRLCACHPKKPRPDEGSFFMPETTKERDK